MADPSPPFTLFGYAFLMVGAVAMMAISLGTTYWLKVEENGMSRHYGLFRGCANSYCINYDDVKHSETTDMDDIKTVRGLCITAIVMYGLTFFVMGHLVFVVLVQKRELHSKVNGFFTLIVSVIAGTFAFSGAIHFVVETGLPPLFSLNDITWTFGYSLYLAILSSALSVGAGICAVFAVINLYRVPSPQTRVIAGPAVQTATPIVAIVPTPAPQYYGPPMNQPVATPYTNQAFVVPQPFVTGKGPPPPYA